MNISPLQNFCLNRLSYKAAAPSEAPSKTFSQAPFQGLKLKPEPASDTVSFGCRTYDDTPEDIQLYRSIGEKELSALLNGETIRGSAHYATSDPKGWSSRNWNSGYVARGNESTYFITFKTDTDFFADDRRDSSSDTRYGVDNYSLKDIKNIRRGANAHGEIVYSENFEADKAKDIELKKQQIEACKKHICSKDILTEDKEKSWDILASYAEEFPNLIDFECDFDDETFVNGLIFYLYKAKNPEYSDLADKCIKSQFEHPYVPIRLEAVSLIEDYGGDSAVDNILALTKIGKTDSYVAASALNRMVKDDKTNEHVINELNTKDPAELLTLVKFSSNRNQDFKYNDLYRKILSDTITDDMYLNNRGFGAYKLSDVIATIASELAREGDMKSIKPLGRFYLKDRPYDYPSAEVKQAIDTILEKNK